MGRLVTAPPSRSHTDSAVGHEYSDPMDLIDSLSTVSEVDRATFEQQWQQWRAARENNLASRHGFLAVTVSLDPPDEQGNVTLDFNRAVNLPCAFTDFATSPLPPAENRLPIAVEADEKVPYERRSA